MRLGTVMVGGCGGDVKQSGQTWATAVFQDRSVKDGGTQDPCSQELQAGVTMAGIEQPTDAMRGTCC